MKAFDHWDDSSGPDAAPRENTVHVPSLIDMNSVRPCWTSPRPQGGTDLVRVNSIQFQIAHVSAGTTRGMKQGSAHHGVRELSPSVAGRSIVKILRFESSGLPMSNLLSLLVTRLPGETSSGSVGNRCGHRRKHYWREWVCDVG